MQGIKKTVLNKSYQLCKAIFGILKRSQKKREKLVTFSSVFFAMYWGGMSSNNMGWGMSMIEEEGWRKGPWTAEEDRLLIEYVRLHGEGRWNSVSRLAGSPLY